MSDKFDIKKHKNYELLEDFNKKNAFDIEEYIKRKGKGKVKMNRTKRICEHIGKSVNGDMLNKKTEYIYNAIKNKGLEIDVKKKKMIGFLQYRIKNTKLLDIDFSKDYKAFNLTVDNTTLDNQLITFRKLRNDFTHDMYRYDSTNPKLINFEDYVDLAKMGIYVAENLCSISSAMKRKKMKL